MKLFYRILFASTLGISFALAAKPIDLTGDYQLHLRSTASMLIPAGEAPANLAALTFSDRMKLPGTTDLAGKGPHVTGAQPYEYHLNREFNHLGPAYYKRRISIPADWKGKAAEMFFERVMWQSRVWIDGKEISAPQDSLSTPHIHKLGVLAPGQHELLIAVDNRMIHPIGDKGHGYGPQTQSTWNGIVGKMEIRPVSQIAKVRIFPSLDGNVKVEITGTFPTGATLSASIAGSAKPFASVSAGGETATLGGMAVAQPVLWSEFTPTTYPLTVTARDAAGKLLASHATTFGFRTASHQGNRLFINGKPAYMRGNLECAVFPKTGHPPVNIADWKRIWEVYKAHNMNHARFHSWCPPEAAFIAADEVGIYLQVETPIWIDFWMTSRNGRPEMNTPGFPQGLGRGDRTTDAFTKAEMRRILDTYGNHPSFVFFCLGNEFGTANFTELEKWIGEGKSYDPRHLYAASTARKITQSCDFNATHDVPGIGPVRAHREFGTNWDYENKYSRTSVPIISHEIGQWPVYVDWEYELPKYTGPLKPYRLQNFAETARKNGLYDRAKALRAASGGSNRILYRDEIESFLRTPSNRGFQLLNMQDFSGQGEALVGWLDSFYDSKGTTDPAEFRRYCAPTVPLLKLPGYIFKPTDKPTVTALVHHYGPADLKNAACEWTLAAANGTRIDSGSFSAMDIPTGHVTNVGNFTLDFSRVEKPTAAKLELTVGDHSNSYDVWIYPDVTQAAPANVVFTEDWALEAKSALAEGKTVVLSAHALGGPKAQRQNAWQPLFWSVPFFPGQGTETLGLLVDNKHPALAGFPTPSFGDWNWFRIANGARGFDFTDVAPPSFRGIAEPVSDFHFNRRLASIFECQVGPGKLLVSGYDITSAADSKPEAAALRRSLLDYAASSKFAPSTILEIAKLDSLFIDPSAPLIAVPKQFAKADLYVRAGGKVRRNGNANWQKELDGVLRKASGVDYNVVTEGIWRDENGTAWHGKKTTVTITPRSGVPGTFHVRFHDWNHNNRTGTVTFEGKEVDLGPHTDGKWLEFPVIREDSNDARFILTAEAKTGPNLMITDIAFVPEE
ncbi:MAG: glycoside hydrolase family 2 TIM barrel-domain containing protein [Verrucomicrobiota bacterium]